MSKVLGSLQINVDVNAQKHKNFLVYMHIKKQTIARQVLMNWKRGIQNANQDEINKFIVIRYFRKLIRSYNSRMHKEISLGVMLRKKLLKRYLFWFLKQNVQRSQLDRIADNFRTQQLLNAWKEQVNMKQIIQVKDKLAINYRDRATRKRLLNRYFKMLKKNYYSAKYLRLKDQQLDMMASLAKKVLASLFINKCQAFMRYNTLNAAEEMRQNYYRKLIIKAFDCLNKNMMIENFKTRKNSELAQLCLYQWSIYVKLNKISSRYNDTSQISNQSTSKHKNTSFYEKENLMNLQNNIPKPSRYRV
ncbi:UNKNOWN [Stylonychia lemnae]|uniref:Uncharacterized protein n=1 Tax=Stylonychia lemnae TaxID=5949 RepID=A0A078AGQ7_STYLE|nr:UNKNOWN [Stylonychia lemnae]|eukprot:CDW80043.1 UNKNOWN [Stylonychia lemnae]